jgi:diguanylate cyclase (GGDEF)-like protein
MSGVERQTVDGDDGQTLSDLDQTTADSDQSASDLDQTYSDLDQNASNRDQRASDRDQEAADHDEAASDGPPGNGEDVAGYARSRRDRSQSAAERNLTTHARSETGRLRDEAAARRDRIAAERDAASQERDELAAALDGAIERLEIAGRGQNGGAPKGTDILMRAAGERRRASARGQREAAARDRDRAAEDRREAARDRAGAAEELALEGIDSLTGTFRRGVGLRATQRELDRTLRTGERLVVAFVDVVGLKSVNDTHGHAAGDDLLRLVAGTIKQQLRSYDVITRFGGDEFVCVLSGRDVSSVHERFNQISIKLAETSERATITVGFAERQKEDSLDQLIRRADEAMLEARQPPEN